MESEHQEIMYKVLYADNWDHEDIPRNHPMRIWYKNTDFGKQAARFLREAGFKWCTMNFGKCGACCAIQITLEDKLQKDDIARLAKVESDLQKIAASTEPYAAPWKFRLAVHPRVWSMEGVWPGAAGICKPPSTRSVTVEYHPVFQ